MGEFDIISRIREIAATRRADVLVGPGDDCACVRGDGTQLLLTEDVMVEGVHFTRSMLDAAALGRRATSVAVSDVAAMGGRPRWLLCSLMAPDLDPRWVEDMAGGMHARASELGACLVGGNLSRAPTIAVSVSVVGEVSSEPLLRSAARPGDVVAVTGTVGGACLGLGILGGEIAAGDDGGHLVSRWRDPPARVDEGLVLGSVASAGIDVSDGLVQDLGHVLDASGVGARIEAASIPLPPGYGDLAPEDDPWGPALQGGEDYELLVSVPPDRLDEAVQGVREAGGDLTAIGRITGPGDGLVVLDADGSALALPSSGWDHFRP